MTWTGLTTTPYPQTADTSAPSANPKECSCPAPLERGPGACPWCIQRAEMVDAFFAEHPNLLRHDWDGP